MRTITNVLLPFLAGVCALAGLVGISSNAPASPLRGEGSGAFVPRARDLVRILEGEAYVVPPGKILTIKTLTSLNSNMAGFPVLKIDGREALGAAASNGPQEFALGVAALAGQSVTVEEVYPDPSVIEEALGYLSDL